MADQGYDAEHVVDIGFEAVADSTIWDRANDTGAVIVTKDEDFSRRRSVSVAGPSVIWLRIGNTTRSQLLQRVKPVFPDVIAAIEAGEVLVEVH